MGSPVSLYKVLSGNTSGLVSNVGVLLPVVFASGDAAKAIKITNEIRVLNDTSDKQAV